MCPYPLYMSFFLRLNFFSHIHTKTLIKKYIGFRSQISYYLYLDILQYLKPMVYIHSFTCMQQYQTVYVCKCV